MKSKQILVSALVLLGAASILAGCGSREARPQVEAQEAPPAAEVIPGANAALVIVDHPEQFPLGSGSADGNGLEPGRADLFLHPAKHESSR